MRDHKAARRSRALASSHCDAVATSVNALSRAGILLRGDVHIRTVKRPLKNGLKFELVSNALSKGGRRPRRLHISAMLRIAYSDVAGRNNVARMFKVKGDWVATLRAVVAATWEQLQRSFVDSLALHMQEGAVLPAVWVTGLTGDETKEKLALRLSSDDADPSLQRSAWNVLVSKHSFSWACLNPQGQPWWMVMDCQRPPVPLLSTTAEAAQHGFYDLPQVLPYTRLENEGTLRAAIAIHHLDTDGASSMIRMGAKKFEQLPPRALFSHHVCSNHNNSHVEGCLVVAVDSKVLPWLYSMGCFFQMGGHFLRLVHAVSLMIDKEMIPPVRGPPPPDPRGFASELENYCRLNYKMFYEGSQADTGAFSSDDESVSPRGAAVPARPRHVHYEQAWRELRAFWNGPLHVDAVGPHYCTSAECCDNYNITVTKRRAARTLSSLLFRLAPTLPSKAKWTRLGPCLDWHLLCQCVFGNVLKKLFPLAFGSMLVRIFASLGSEDQSYAQDVKWEHVAGVRLAAAKAGLARKENVVSIVIMSIFDEPVRWLTRWFMARSSHQRRHKSRERGKAPPLCSLAWDVASPATRVLQYLSSVMEGTAPRLKLLWGRSHDSFLEWAAACPAHLAMLRRVCACVSSWVWARHLEPYMRWPWKLAGLVDARRPTEDRRQIAHDFCAAPSDALDESFSRRLRLHVGTQIDALFTREWQMALWMWAWTVLLSIAAMERLHSRNRRRSHPCERWDRFVSNFLNAEARLMLEKDRAALEARSRLRLSDDAAQPRARKRCRQSPYEAFRYAYYADCKRAGRKFNVADPAFASEVRDALNALPPDRKLLYSQLAESAAIAPRVFGSLALPADALVADTTASAIAPFHAPVVLKHVPAAPLQVARVMSSFRGPLATVDECPEYPLAACNLSAALSEDGRRVSLERMAESFRELHTTVGTGADRAFGSVRYPQRSFANLPSAERSNLCEVIMASVVSLCKGALPKGNLAVVYQHNLVIAAELSFIDMYDDECVSVVFVSVCSGHNQAGILPVRLNMAWLETCGASDAQGSKETWLGVVLRYRRLPHIETKRLPFGGISDVGVIDHTDLHSFCVNLLGRHSGLLKVSLHLAETLLVNGDMFKIVHVPGGTRSVQVACNATLETETTAKKDPPLPDEFDWLSGVVPSKKAARQDARPSGGGPAASGGEGGVAAAPIRDLRFLLGDEAHKDIAESCLLLGEHTESEYDSDVEKGAAAPTPASGGPESALVGGDAASSSSAPQAPGELGAAMATTSTSSSSSLVPGNILSSLGSVHTAEEVCRLVPGFSVGSDWKIRRAVDGKVIGTIRCIQGRSLRIDCGSHKPDGRSNMCKLHVDSEGKHKAVESLLVKWCLDGVAMDRNSHIALAKVASGMGKSLR